MKKLVCIAVLALGLAGCGGSEEKPEVMTCSLETKNDGFTITQKVDFEYAGKSVTKQTQTSTIVAENDEFYDVLETASKAQKVDETVKDIKGATYSIDYDKEAKKIDEKFVFDLTVVSGKDYSKLTGQTYTSDKPISMDIDKTKENLEKTADMTCKK